MYCNVLKLYELPYSSWGPEKLSAVLAAANGDP
jgi:hypothetical protein